MSYALWHKKAVKKAGTTSEFKLYIHTMIFGLLMFAATYWYITWLKIPNPLNKAVADTSILLISMSMLLSSLCYFWNFVDSKIIYRKHLGLIGFAFGVAHVALSFSAVQRLFSLETWQKGAPWPLLAGAGATVIFSIMAAASNHYAAHVLGGQAWRRVLRTGYIAVILIWIHVFLLKSSYIVKWYAGGMKTPPSTSLIVLVFMALVIAMRVALWVALKKQAKQQVQKG